MELTVGSRWKSVVCDTEVVVVRPPDAPKILGCGGVEMAPFGADTGRGAIDQALAGGTQLGKRYTDESSGIEVLCTHAGEGTLTLDGERLELKGAKPLPSSD
jgi:hypothetical protein